MKSLPQYAYPLSIAAGALAAMSALAGLFFESTYAAEMQSFAIQGRAQDLVTLVWVVPLFGISLRYMKQDYFPARIAWMGILLYFTYTYALAAMGLAYNRLFLLYVTIFALSLALLITGLSGVRWNDIRWRFSSRFPQTPTAAFVISMGVLVALLWLADIVPSIVTGTPPPQLAETVSQSLVVQALDLGIVVPLFILGGVLLLKRMSLGYLLTGLALVKSITLGPAMLAMAVFLNSAGLPVAPPLWAFAALVTGFGGYLSYRYFRSLY
ncbi:MAG: hypothetical protein JW846_10600 [Dehalococcoidia bacterium]|nr:hypothetical protein [Dehalococcoidia bacterium]